MQIRRVLAAVAVLAFSVVPWRRGARRTTTRTSPKRSKTEQQDVDLSVAMVDRVIQGAMPAPADYTLTWESNHFTKGQDGQTYIAVHDRGGQGARREAGGLLRRVVEKGAPPPAAPDPKAKDDKNAPGAPELPVGAHHVHAGARLGQDVARVRLKPGDYDVYITLKEKSTAEIKDLAKAPPPKMAFIKRELTVPDYNGAELKMSTPILARHRRAAARAA
jgi:hypothetical protein